MLPRSSSTPATVDLRHHQRVAA